MWLMLQNLSIYKHNQWLICILRFFKAGLVQFWIIDSSEICGKSQLASPTFFVPKEYGTIFSVGLTFHNLAEGTTVLTLTSTVSASSCNNTFGNTCMLSACGLFTKSWQSTVPNNNKQNLKRIYTIVRNSFLIVVWFLLCRRKNCKIIKLLGYFVIK